VGIVGGFGPESTIAYCRAIVDGFRQRTGGTQYPRVIINSIDASAMLALIPQQRFDDLGLHRLALLGTRFTMDATFYSNALGSVGIEVIAPPRDGRDYVHEKYMTDLFSGDIPQSTRDGITAVVARMMAANQVDGVIVGGTELFPLVGDFRRLGTAVLDTTAIHANAAVERLLTA
jgi:aspartate racemase